MTQITARLCDNRVDFEFNNFSESFIKKVKGILNIYGDYDKSPKPQDHLKNAYGWIHKDSGGTGLTCQFEWKSGRKDALVVPPVEGLEGEDTMNTVCMVLMGSQKEQINFLKGKLHD